MLKDQPNQGLLPKQQTRSPPTKSRQRSNSTSQLSQPQPKPKKQSQVSKTPSKKKERSPLTYILKFMNFIVGIIYIAFAVYCYSNGLNESSLDKATFLKYLMPAYIGLSGLIIFLVQCRFGLVINNLRCFYNYFGRGLFNIYAGGMPLMLISDIAKLDTFGILTLVASSVMILIGVLYISLKVFCCEKEGRKLDQDSRIRQESDSD